MPPPRLKRSNTASAVPASLEDGEVAINQADGRLYYRTVAGGVSALAVSSSAHSHGNITGAGAIGTTAGLLVITGGSGVLTTSATISASQVTGLAAVCSTNSYTDLIDKPSIPAAYTLPTASGSVTGGVRIGSGISIDANGVISASVGYTLPAATSSTLGGCIVGTGISVSSGTISVSYGTTAGTACQGNDSRLSDARTPASHVHGNISSQGAIGITAGQLVVTGASGVLTTAATIAASAVAGLATVATSGSYADLSNRPASSLVEATTAAGFPAAGASQTLYISRDYSRVYRWDSSGVYIELGN
jgi:hypothetical protein